MILNNLNIVGRNSDKYSIEIKNGKIFSIIKSPGINSSSGNTITFENVISFPGLINSHDHLEFNLFPRLGNKKYQDYIEWGEDIHQKNEDEIKSVLEIPIDLRIKFGIYKNLLSGTTTIIHHGNNFNSFKDEIIDIKTGGRIIHSVKLQKKWKSALNNPFNFEKVLIHTGEGSNDESKKEIDELLKWNFLNKKLIGIHAISMNEEQAEKFNAIVWCPDSNQFLYEKTANIGLLKNRTKILFGTDSTLSSDWNIWNHLRFARKLNLLNDLELFDSLTKNPAEVFNLKGYGELKENYFADIIIARKKNENIWESFYAVNPEDIILILKKGEVILFDEEILPEIKKLNVEFNRFYQYHFKNKTKYILYNINKSFDERSTFPFYRDCVKIGECHFE